MSNLNDPRVVLAVERTLLAWNRTSLSLIAFGFVMERGGILMQTIAPEVVHPSLLTMTFWLGLAFMLLGTVASAYSARQYVIVLRTLAPAEFPPGYSARWGGAAQFVGWRVRADPAGGALVLARTLRRDRRLPVRTTKV